MTLICDKNIPHSCQTKSYSVYMYPIFTLLLLLDIWWTILDFLCFTKHPKWIYFFTIFNYFLISAHFISVKFFLELIYEISPKNITFLTVIEYSTKLFLHFIGAIEFIQSLVINIIVPITVFTFYHSLNNIDLVFCEISFIILDWGLIASGYIITLINKKNAYYQNKLHDDNKESEMVLNNLNCGYIRVKDKEIVSINKSWMNIWLSTNEIKKVMDCNNIGVSSTAPDINKSKRWFNIVSKKKEIVWRVLLSSLNTLNDDDDDLWLNEPFNSGFNSCRSNHNWSTHNHTATNSNNIWNKKPVLNTNMKILNPRNSEYLLQQISKKYKVIKLNHQTNQEGKQEDIVIKMKHEENSNFVFIDYSIINLEEKRKIIYEVYCRHENNEYEFIFKDVTRTKEYEEKNFNFKVQNFFLTKVAHEFKNPLVCWKEWNSQMNDICRNWEDVVIRKQLNKIGNLINIYNDYLLLMIKDLDYFSGINKKKLNQKEENKINVKELAQFWEEIATEKISRDQKCNEVDFITYIDSQIPFEIVSDETKIKQIWMNLIDNAIKFTEKGRIVLRIEKEESEENVLKFILEDTGIGLDEDIQESWRELFNSKGNSCCNREDQEYNLTEDNQVINCMNSNKGIGLLIVKTLVSSWKSKLYFTSSLNEGSKFWFYLSSPIVTKLTTTNVSPPYSLKQVESTHELISVAPNTHRESLTSIKTILIPQENYNLKLHKQIESIAIDLPNYNIIIADDEDLARKALIRVLLSTASKFNINLTIIDASDGAEVLFKIYQSNFGGFQRKISAVITDQTMNFINGFECKKILSLNVNQKEQMWYYIVTAYNSNLEFFNGIELNGIFSKPFRNTNAEVIIKELINTNKSIN